MQPFPPSLVAGDFDIQQTLYTFSSATDQVIAGTNANRVALMIGVVQSGPVYVRTSKMSATFQGFALTSSMVPWLVLHREVGALCGIEWHGIANIGTKVFVIESIYHPCRGD